MAKKILSFMGMLILMAGTLLAQDGQAPPRDTGMWQTLTMIIIAIIFFYFILWRPEQKRRKALEIQRSSMKKGDRVVAMGIIGTVDRVDERTVVLRMLDGSKIEVLKGMITEVTAPGTAPGSEEKDQSKDS